MPNLWIQKLNESNSRLHKEDTITQAHSAAIIGAKDAQAFLRLAWHAYNPFETFNIKKVPTTEGNSGKDNDIDAFEEFLDRLKNREVTGNAALSEMEATSMNYDSDLWNELLRPTILKDLRIGATINTFNKILKKTEFEIPEFNCQLATDSAKHPKKLSGTKRLEPKLDGIRACVVVDLSFPENTKVTVHTRNGKLLVNFPQIEDQIREAVQMHRLPDDWKNFDKFVLDGEIVSENFQALMKQARRKTDVDTSAAVYSIFDIVPLDKFNSGKWTTEQSVRSELLESAAERFSEFPSLHIITGFEVDLDTEEGYARMLEYGQEMVDDGYEGIMVKDPSAPYVCKRRTAWLKWKPFILVDLTIVGFELGKADGKNAHRLGALVCEGLDESSGKFIRVNAGGGYTDAQRDEFWDMQDELLGHLVEIKADVITQSEKGDDVYSLRFPRFTRFRDIEIGDKI